MTAAHPQSEPDAPAGAGDEPARASAATAPGASAEPTEREAWALLLAVDGIGPAGFGAVLRATGSALGALHVARRPGGAARLGRIAAEGDGRPAVGGALGAELAASLGRIPDRLATLRSAGLEVVTLDDPGYPSRLRSIELPPPVLFVRGRVEVAEARHVVAIVGTRRPTERGRQLASRIAAVVAATGAVVVSGLAVGIDGAAHAATVQERRPTVAVIGSGHHQLFPRAHLRLAARILGAGGVVCSEFWPDVPPATWTFPRRNRVISGLADATIVVEAGERSGALITAKWALDQGRELFIVPGPLDEPRSAGCLLWLREYAGVARIVARIPELIEDLGLLLDRGQDVADRPAPPSLGAVLAELGETARTVGAALVAGHGRLDELVVATDLAPATVLGAITLLELRGLATSTYGRYRPAGQLAAASPEPPAGRLRRA
jgi:DNA processing protein